MLQSLEDIQFIGQCPVCNEKYDRDTVSVVDRVEERIMLLAECGKCKSSVILFVTGKVRGIVTTVGMLTDLTHEDLALLKLRAPLTADDVLEVHRHLERISKKKIT